MSKKQASDNPSPRKRRPITAIFLVLWTFICIYFGQLFFALIFVLFPDNLLDQPVWSTVYTALSYSLSLFLILFIPHKSPHRWPLVAFILSALILLYFFLAGQLSLLFLAITILTLAFLLGQSKNKTSKKAGSTPLKRNVTEATAELEAPSARNESSRSREKRKFRFLFRETEEVSLRDGPDGRRFREEGSPAHYITRSSLGLTGLPTWTDLGLAPIGYIVALLLGSLLVALFSIFPWFDLTEAQDVGFNSVYSGFDRLVTFIALVIIAPIAEELIFRGWLYGKLRAFLKAPVAIAIVSAFFGFMHGQWNVGLTVFAMSIILCLMREITGTIYAGIIMHMLKNAVAFVLLYIVNFA